jgi:hypothetical protein
MSNESRTNGSPCVKRIRLVSPCWIANLLADPYKRARSANMADDGGRRDFINIEHDIAEAITLEMIGDHATEDHIDESGTATPVRLRAQHDFSIRSVNRVTR